MPLQIFGNHNLQNLNAAKNVCNEIGISDIDFYQHIKTFKGASNRLELIKKNKEYSIYKDFAHSPSKLKATIEAMKYQFNNRKLIACMELHTFSSLNSKFLKEYRDSMNLADQAIVFFSQKAIKHKKLTPITEEQIKAAFNNNQLKIISNSKDLIKHLKSLSLENTNLLMMSSGNFDKINLDEI